MKHLVYYGIFGLVFMLFSYVSVAGDFDVRVPMKDLGASTFYVNAEIRFLGEVQLMVDTGSGYLTINEETLAILQKNTEIRYIKQLQGVLANGSELEVPVYSLPSLNLGGECLLHDVEAAVFPGNTRLILGLSALSRAAPFIFSVNPPELVLSHCT